MMSWRAERLLVQLPRYRAPGPPKRAATAKQSDFFMGLNEDAAGVVVGHVDDVPSLRNLTQVNKPSKKLAERALWKQFFFKSDERPPKTEDEVTDMHIDRYLKADGFGVRALADACRRFSNLVRLHAHGCEVHLAAIKVDPPRSLAAVRSHVTGQASASAHGLALAVYALAQLLANATLTEVSVPDFAFHHDDTITSIEVPKGFTAMGSRAFFRCESLASVKLPAGLTSIGEHAFKKTSLASVELPAGLTTIGYGAFYECTTLASVVFPVGLTRIDYNAFQGCTELASIELLAGLTTIGDCAFQDCTSLASVKLPAGLTSIGEYAFADCTSLASIELPAGLTRIGNGAFYQCTSLASVVFPASLTSIGQGAFAGCTSLASVELPGLTTLGIDAFSAAVTIVRRVPVAGVG